MVDALDSKSCVLKRRAGSIPASGTINPNRHQSKGVFLFQDLKFGHIWTQNLPNRDWSIKNEATFGGLISH